MSEFPAPDTTGVHALVDNELDAIEYGPYPYQEDGPLTEIIEPPSAALVVKDDAPAIPNPANQLLELLEANLPVKTQRNLSRYRNERGQLIGGTRDPHILARRAFAMPLWNDGLNAHEVTTLVNEWLERQGKPVVDVSVVRLDHKHVIADWEADFDHSSAESRALHIASISAVKRQALESYRDLKDKGKQGGGSAGAYLKLAMQCDVELARLDGSFKRAEMLAEQGAADESATTIVRIYKGVDMEQV